MFLVDLVVACAGEHEQERLTDVCSWRSVRTLQRLAR